ncbi:MAG: YihY/virulence factor BrkB family protein [Planctomycetes bacterium]|nr:YihY/virulence factor BrkB family protein [Planctomycetota bacterium]
MGLPSAVARRARGVWDAVAETFSEFWADEPFEMSAALSFYTLLSLSPLLLVVVGVAGFVFGEDAVRGRILHEMQVLLGDQGARAVRTVIDRTDLAASGWVSTLVGLATLLFGATTVFVQLQSALNRIWDVKAAPSRVKGALLTFLRQRLLSLAMVLAIGFLLLVSLTLNAALAAVDAYLAHALPDRAALWRLLNSGVSFALVTLLIAMMFKFLPDRYIAWRDVWFGALLTGVLLALGKYLIGLYLGQATFASAFGAAASVVIFMVWVYYASMILFFGAEVTQVYSRRSHHGRLPAPSPHAVDEPR